MRRDKLAGIVYDCAVEAGYGLYAAGEIAKAVDNPSVTRVAHGAYVLDDGTACPLTLAGRPGTFNQQSAFWRNYDDRMMHKSLLPFNGVRKNVVRVSG